MIIELTFHVARIQRLEYLIILSYSLAHSSSGDKLSDYEKERKIMYTPIMYQDATLHHLRIKQMTTKTHRSQFSAYFLVVGFFSVCFR